MTGKAAATSEARRIISSDGLDLVAPACEKGIGTVIASPDSDRLIHGVRIEPVALWPDDRGYFLEVPRLGGTFPRFIHASVRGAQLSGYDQGLSLSPASNRLLDAGCGYAAGCAV